MKLYVCWTGAKKMGPRTHPCGVALEALREAGHDPEVEKARGWRLLPHFLNNSPGRRRVRELSGGDDSVPALVLNDGTFVQGTKEIVSWARENPAVPAPPG